MTFAPLFISHGAPDVLTNDSEAHHALRTMDLDPATRAVVIISAHWEADPVRVTSGRTLETIHDFGGFAPELYEARYPASGDPALAERLVRLLNSEGLAAQADPARGLDHGAWIPMALIRPDADLPVIQFSTPGSDDDAIALGRALSGLAGDGIQLIASGSLTHSLRDSLHAPETAEPAHFARAFRDHLLPAIENGDVAELEDWRDAPEARRNHPTPEHFRPLLVAMAAGRGAPGVCLHHSWSRSALAMDIWRFG